MSTKRSLALLGASSLLLSILPAAAFAQDTTALTIDKLAETANAQQISALWAKEVGKADHVLIATDKAFSDSLASGSLQGSMKAPLFFVGDKLDDVTKTAIKELGATKATILGNEGAISADVAAALKADGLTVDRIGGVARIETSVAIAETHEDVDSVIIARQDSYADALAAGALSAKTGMPIIVVNTKPYPGPDGEVTLHPVVAKYLADHSIKNATVIGGTAAVNADVFNAIDAIVENTDRVEGAERIETANNLAAKWGEDSGRRVVVEGHATDTTTGYYNGFAAALTAANNNAPVLLTNQTSANTAAITAKTGVAAYCGTQVNTTICNTLAETLGATINNITLVNKDEDQTPDDAAVKMTPAETETVTGASTNSPNRVYTVTGLKADTKYNLVVAKAEMKDGAYTVKMKNKQPEASTDATITVVNGVQANSTEGLMADADGKIVFTLSANKNNVDATVIPVIVEKDKSKEVLAQGGAVTIKPTEVSNSYAFLGKIVSIDKDNKTLIVKGKENTDNSQVNADFSTSTGFETYTISYANAADTFYTHAYNQNGNQNPAAAAANAQLTLAQFEGKLSVGDIVGSQAYYNKTSGLASVFTFTSLNPGKVDATKITGTAKENSVEFELKKSADEATFNALKDGQIEVRYAKLNKDITAAMQSSSTATLNAVTDIADSSGATDFIYGYVSNAQNGKSFKEVVYNRTGVGSASDTDDTVAASVEDIASSNIKTAKFSNASDKPAESFKFTVDDLDANSSYAFTYRIIAANGEEGEWNTPSAAVAARAIPTSNTLANLKGDVANINSNELAAANKTADVFRTTKDPVDVTIKSAFFSNDPTGTISNTGRQIIKVTLDGTAYQGGKVDPDKIEVTFKKSNGSTGVIKVDEAGSTASNTAETLTNNSNISSGGDVFLKLANPIGASNGANEVTITFKQGAFTTNTTSPNNADPSKPATYSFNFR